jgi:hypothetical protein
MLLRDGLIRWRRLQGGQHTAPTDQRPRPFPRLPAPGIDDHIHVMGEILEPLCAVVDDHVGSQSSDPVEIMGGCGCDDMGAGVWAAESVQHYHGHVGIGGRLARWADSDDLEESEVAANGWLCAGGIAARGCAT